MKRALESWFAERGWKPFKFQKDVWSAIARGESRLLHATTGVGKTHAVWLGALMDFRAVAPVIRAQEAIKYIAALTPQSGLNAPPIRTRIRTRPGWAGLRSGASSRKGLAIV